MSAYDIAAGASPDGLDSLIGSLYAAPAVRQGLFKGSLTKPVTTGVTATVAYDVKSAPKFVLTPPTAQQWSAAQKQPSNAPLPTANAFQLVLSDVAATAQLAGGAPLKAEGVVTAFGLVTTANGVVALTFVGLLIDETAFSVFDKVIVNEVLVPALIILANSALAALPLPQLPLLEGLTFHPLALAVSPTGLAAAASLTSDPVPDLSGFQFPGPALFLLAKDAAISKVLAKAVPGTASDEKQTGPSSWSAAGRVTASNLSVTIAPSAAPTVGVQGTFSAYGELSGAGVGVAKAVLCPIGAAADAIAHPSKWDKVVSSFELVYNPHPLPIPVTVTAGPVQGSGSAQTQPVMVKVPSDKLPSSIKLLVKPTWSGSVTGAALSAAASAFVDLVMEVFGSLIIKKIVSAVGQKTFSLPVSAMSTRLPLPNNVAVNLQLAAAPNSSLQAFNGDQLLVALQINIA